MSSETCSIPQAIIFDLGGVILNLDYSATIRAFERLVPVDPATFYGSKHQLDFFSNYEIGRISTDEVIGAFNRHYKTNLSHEEFESAWNAMLFDFPRPRIEFIKRISQNARIFLLSNINELHLKRVQQIYSTLKMDDSFESLFERVYYSHQIGLRKPSQEVFRRIMEDNQLNPETTLFIDDSIQHVEGARELGIKTIHLSKSMDLTQVWLTQERL